MDPAMLGPVGLLAGSALTQLVHWRSARARVAGDERVADTANEPLFAQQLMDALREIGELQAKLATERGRVGGLVLKLENVTAERDTLSCEVEQLRGRLSATSARLDQLEGQLGSLAHHLGGLIPAQATGEDEVEPA